MEYHLKSINPGKNRYRFYNLEIQQDLFGNSKPQGVARVIAGAACDCIEGRIGSSGRSKLLYFEDYVKAAIETKIILQLRCKHGYVIL